MANIFDTSKDIKPVGRFAPAVDYGATVKTPDVQAPRLEKPERSFNIDLSPVGQAILGIQEMKIKKEMAEDERAFEWNKLQYSTDKQFELKQMELDAQKDADNRKLAVNWYNAHSNRMKIEADIAKEKKEKAQDTSNKDAERYIYGSKLHKDYLDLNEGRISEAAFRARVKSNIDDIVANNPNASVNHIYDSVEKQLPGMSKYMSSFRIQEANAQKDSAVSLEIEENKSLVQNNPTLKTLASVDPVGALLRAQRDSQDIDAIKRDYAILEDGTDLDAVSAAMVDIKRRKDGPLDTFLMGTLNHIRENLSTSTDIPAMRVQLLQGYLAQAQALDPLGYSQDLDRLTNKFNRYWEVQMQPLVNTIQSYNENELDRYDKVFKTVVAKNKANLLSRPGALGQLYSLYESAPKFFEILMDKADTSALNIMDVIYQSSAGTFKYNPDNTVTYTDGAGNKTSFTEEDIEILKNSTGQKDPHSAILQLKYNAGMIGANNYDLLPKKDTEKLYYGGVMASLDHDGTAEGFKNAVNNSAEYDKNTPQILPEDKKRILSKGNDPRALDKMSANVKLQKAYGPRKTASIFTNINQLAVSASPFAEDYVKGGKILIIPNNDGTVDLYRDVKGALGGVGNINFWVYSSFVSDDLEKAGLTQSEIIGVYTEMLPEGSFQVTNKGYNVPFSKELKNTILNMVGLPIEGGLTGGSTLVNALAEAVDLAKDRSKSDMRSSSANAEFYNPSTTEPEEKRIEASPIKTTPRINGVLTSLGNGHWSLTRDDGSVQEFTYDEEMTESEVMEDLYNSGLR